ncbi:MAG: hypothetical protein HYS22_06010 [Deltaproteobacteria bacterium]|nr:hypothetical protein [Deltaproteobacteria bacterium]
MGSEAQSPSWVVHSSDRSYLSRLPVVTEKVFLEVEPGDQAGDGEVTLRVHRGPDCTDSYQVTYSPQQIKINGETCRGKPIISTHPMADSPPDWRWLPVIFEKYDRNTADNIGQWRQEIVTFVSHPGQEGNLRALTDPVYDPLKEFWVATRRIPSKEKRDSLVAFVNGLTPLLASGSSWKTLEEATFGTFGRGHLMPQTDEEGLLAFANYFALERQPARLGDTPFRSEDEAAYFLTLPAVKSLVAKESPAFFKVLDQARGGKSEALEAFRTRYREAWLRAVSEDPDGAARLKGLKGQMRDTGGQSPLSFVEERYKTALTVIIERTLYGREIARSEIALDEQLLALGITIDVEAIDEQFRKLFEERLTAPEADAAEFEAIRIASIALYFYNVRRVEETVGHLLTPEEVMRWRSFFSQRFDKDVVGVVARKIISLGETPPLVTARIARLYPLPEGETLTPEKIASATEPLVLERINKGSLSIEALLATTPDPAHPEQGEALEILKGAIQQASPEVPSTFTHSWEDSRKARDLLEEKVVGKGEISWLKGVILILLEASRGDQLRLEPDARLEWLDFLASHGEVVRLGDVEGPPLQSVVSPMPTARATGSAGPAETAPSFGWGEFGSSFGVAVAGAAGVLVADHNRRADWAQIATGAAVAGTSNLLTQIIWYSLDPKGESHNRWYRRLGALGVGAGVWGVSWRMDLFTPPRPFQPGKPAGPDKPGDNQPPTGNDHRRPPESGIEGGD